ncbi:MAG: response regulator [Lachnospiraceae bacterium]
MGNQLVWNKRYDIGVEIIDKEHKKLFSILNKLFDFGQEEDKRQWVCQESVKYFKDHALQHFADEEAYMASIDYEGLEVHRRIHNNFREITMPALEKELEMTGYSENAVDHFLGVCAGWLIGHTTIEDHAIVTGKPIKQWEKLLPDEEQAVMGQSIVSQLHSMFRLESHLISNCYGGEKFGSGVYYRLIYTTKEKKRWEFLLVLEEQLIMNTIGSVIKTTTAAVNTMLMNAARYTARQLVEHIKVHFSELEKAEIKEEQLLSYEQFHKVFEKHSPQYSLLFDTGKGYFAYCMTTVDMVAIEDGVSIITENAMSAVEQYLAQNEAEKAAASGRKKVLIVDDSVFILKTIQDVLSADYEVAAVSSGVAALRSIVLDRPDLILLDYEMPVCKGDQILEMIRSEEEYADISVIFLTSRVDKERIEKVFALKPSGYLSKTLSPEAVKKEVDHFFGRSANASKT